MNRNIIIFITWISFIALILGCNNAVINKLLIEGSFDNTYQAVINSNSNVTIYGEPNESYNFDGWEDIRSISIGFINAGAVKHDGTVLITGEKNGVYQAIKWTDIQIIRFTADRVFGLKNDGTVVYTDNNIDNPLTSESFTDGENDVVIGSNEEPIISNQHPQLEHSEVIKPDSDKTDTFIPVKEWNEIKYIETSLVSIVGIKENGEVVGAGLHPDVSEQIKNWRDVKSISLALDRVVGITSNGEILFADRHGYSLPYQEIKGAVKVCTGETYVAALMPDGTVKIRYAVIPWWPSIDNNSVEITPEIHKKIQMELADPLKVLDNEKDVVDISINVELLTILKKDGTVLTG